MNHRLLASRKKANCLEQLAANAGTCRFTMTVQPHPGDRNHFKWGAFNGKVRFTMTRGDQDDYCLFVEDPNGNMTKGGYDGKPLLKGRCDSVTRSYWNLVASIGGREYGVAVSGLQDQFRTPGQHCNHVKRETLSEIKVLGGLEQMCG